MFEKTQETNTIEAYEAFLQKYPDSEFSTKVKSILDSWVIKDIDGNVYRTVKIGDQWWLAENLKVTRYRNGKAIPYVKDDIEWGNLSTGAYCSYDNDSSNVATYGHLYNCYAVDDSRNIALAGWHVPTDEEWKELEMYLGISQSEVEDTSWRGTNEGRKLAGNRSLWDSGDLENNEAFGKSGFSALPGGCRDYDGGFGSLGGAASFWSSTQFSSNYAWTRDLNYRDSGVLRYGSSKHYGFSVRLIRDY